MNIRNDHKRSPSDKGFDLPKVSSQCPLINKGVLFDLTATGLKSLEKGNSGKAYQVLVSILACLQDCLKCH